MAKKMLTIELNAPNLLTLGAAGLLAFSALPQLTAAANADGEAEATDLGATAYIAGAKRFLSAGNYKVLGSLYRIRAALAEAAEIDFASANTREAGLADIFGALGEIEPYLSRTKRDSVARLLDTAERARDTSGKLKRAKERVNSAGGGLARIKAIASELPALSGVPALEQYARLRDIGDAIAPLLEMLPTKKEAPEAESALEAEFTPEDADEAEIEEIFDLVDMLDSRAAGRAARTDRKKPKA